MLRPARFEQENLSCRGAQALHAPNRPAQASEQTARSDRLTAELLRAHRQRGNQTGGAVLAVLEEAAWTRDATTAAKVTTLREFRDLFSSEVLAPGQQHAIRHIALVFSDLRGSTRLYEGIGDAAAYSRVNRHFEFIRETVGRFDGTVVKTLGCGRRTVRLPPPWPGRRATVGPPEAGRETGKSGGFLGQHLLFERAAAGNRGARAARAGL
jgi:hypothetical protein